MKKNFFWRFVLCITPCVLASIVVVVAILRYTRGEEGGAKFGVDLVGGTILVYEIDWRKQQGRTPAERDLLRLRKAGKTWEEILETPGIKKLGSTKAELEEKFKEIEKEAAAQDAETSVNVLAAALKRRIDPNDLYNIIIRPAPGEGRVEIIIPTGGTYRAQKADNAWRGDKKGKTEKAKKGVLGLVAEEFKVPREELEGVARGRVHDLAELIHAIKTKAKWKDHIFNNAAAWNKLLSKIELQWQQFDLASIWVADKDKFLHKNDNVAIPTAVALAVSPDVATAGLNSLSAYVLAPMTLTPYAKMHQVPVGNIDQLIQVVQQQLGPDTSEKELEFFVKQQAWNVLLEKAQEQWPQLNAHKAALDRIPSDKTGQLISFIQAGGNVVNQAGIAIFQSLLGSSVVKTGKDRPFVDREEVEKWVAENYGPSLDGLISRINKLNTTTGRSKDLTIEEVQRIKELVSRVGSLEFRILANQVDDKEAIDLIKKQLREWHSNQVAQELKDRQDKGLPPPGPRVEGSETATLKQFDIKLPRGYKSKITYSWVELGPQERKELNLDNAAKNEPRRNQNWLDMNAARAGQGGPEKNDYVVQLNVPGTKKHAFQGAVFYSRVSTDRTISAEERANKKLEYFVLSRNPEIENEEKPNENKVDGQYLVSARSDISQGRPAVNFQFNNEGARLFGKLTRKNVPSGQGADKVRRHLAIILDGLMMSAPTVNSEIRGSGQITGSFRKQDVDNLVNILRSGALPTSLKQQPVSESTMGATLGQDTIRSGFWAVVWALSAVLVFMTLYYRFAGFVASCALLANLLLTVGFMVAVNATFTLPGLAGLVLMLGMAVDANVLIYERIREERDRGSTLALSIRNGYIRAFPPIIDTHLSSIFTAIVLYVVGNDQLKGFAVSLTVGLIISLFTSLYMTRTLFEFWLHKGWLKKLSMFRLLQKPDIDFMGVRHYLFTGTLVLAVAGFALFIGRLPNDLGIDFTGGTAYGGRLVQGEAKDIQGLRDLVADDRQKELLTVKSVKRVGDEGWVFSVIYIEPDGTETAPRTVSLANAPNGESVAEWEADVKDRLSRIPDISVEQIFPSVDKTNDPNKSHFFTVRTSEKETEIVQSSIDRMMTKKGNDKNYVSILEKVYLYTEPLQPRGTRLWFYQSRPPSKFDPQANSRMKKPAFEPAFASPSFVQTLFTKEVLKAFGKKEKDELRFQYEFIGEGESNEGRRQILNLKFTPRLNPNEMAEVQKALDSFAVEFETHPQPERLENFDSQLAADTRLRAMWAVLASWAAVLLYLWFRFGNWTFGLAAVVCLVHDLFLTLGIIAACHFVYASWFGQLLKLEDFKVDLPAVAAFLTLVGYSVADTIVVFDRIREVRGKNPDLTPDIVNDSVNQCLSRTILTSLTTFLVVSVLYWFGGPGIHLFAFIMVIGVLVGTYSSIYIASPLLLILGEGVRAAEQKAGAKTEAVTT